MRIAVIDKDSCKPAGCGGYLCARVCPVNRAGKECILDTEKKAVINAELCIGCGICVNKCPFEAITIVNLPEELEEQCFHSYGQNDFKLYRAPVPIPNQVVGLVGQNGTGKSTALKALAGDLNPNLGGDEAATMEQLSKYFAGSELQAYFSDIENKKMAYKPQYVDQFPRAFRGTVKSLLEKADERKILDKLVKEFGLENCISTKISEVSGGELQKAAIAATIMKDADIYFFDEPSSYLDVRERLKVARAIRELAEERLVLVVEHDLIVLDYLADLAHIFYGKPAAYGIVSFPKAARMGINEYLAGYMKEENVKFRDYPIKFLIKTAKEEIKRYPLVSFKGIKKKFASFELDIEEGELRNREIVGIMGSNGIGKTTFMKILAGVLNADEGEISQEVKIAYKPQYIQADEDMIVRVVLKKAEQSLITKLGLEKLLDKPVSQISGGELQRVAIAECLSKDADIYLLDEPSAHLDVEQRVNVANILKRAIDEKEKSAFVIDHDIMFLDYLSDRLMVFLGESGKSGKGHGPFSMKKGMNLFLKDLGITFRRDPDTGRPRANKGGSVKDREQKQSGEYYYVK